MEVKHAVVVAKQHVSDLFAPEDITNVGLEEIEVDEKRDEWQVTIGFARPWDGQGTFAAAAGLARRRTYKIVVISDASGRVLAVRHRALAQH